MILADVDPVRDFDDPEGWKRALSAAKFTLSISMLPGESGRAANVHLPAESHAEKEGTLTHPDGRLQRVRPSVPRPGAVRPVWQALSELSGRLGDDPGAGTAGEVFDLIAAEVPFYAGITVDDIGGMGLRWQDRHGLAGGRRARRRRAASACDARRPTGSCGSGPTPTSGPTTSPRTTRRCDSWRSSRRSSSGPMTPSGSASSTVSGSRSAPTAARSSRRSASASGCSTGTAFLTRGTATDPAGSPRRCHEHRRRPRAAARARARSGAAGWGRRRRGAA